MHNLHALKVASYLILTFTSLWKAVIIQLLFWFFFSGLTIQANMYYKMLISWTSQKVKETYNAFDFKNGMYMFYYFFWGDRSSAWLCSINNMEIVISRQFSSEPLTSVDLLHFYFIRSLEITLNFKFSKFMCLKPYPYNSKILMLLL